MTEMNSNDICMAAVTGVILSACSVCASEAGPKEGRLSLATMPRMVKGFPMLLKLTATGKQTIAKMSLFDEIAEVVVVLRTKPPAKETEYRIRSSRGMETILTTRAGERVDAANRHRMQLGKDQKVAMLLDISSLRPELGKGLTADGVPLGAYSLRVSFPFSDMTSNAVDVELVAPSTDERKYLRELAKRNRVRRSWSRMLREAEDLSNLNEASLGGTAKLQLSFHVLLSRVLSCKGPLNEDVTRALGSRQVPQYLQPEKDFVLWEVAMSSKAVAVPREKEKAFFDANPELEWRLATVRAGSGSFLLYRLDATRETPQQ